MAVAVVGSPTVTNLASTSSYTFSRTITATNPMVVVHFCSSGTNITSISGGGATWSQITSAILGGSLGMEFWQGINNTGGAVTITVNVSGTDTVGGILTEFSGANISTPIESKNITDYAGSFQTSMSPTATPSVTGDLVLLAVASNGGISGAPSSPWTTAQATLSGTGRLGTAWQSGTASTPLSGTWTQTNQSAASGAMVIAQVTAPTLPTTYRVVSARQAISRASTY